MQRSKAKSVVILAGFVALVTVIGCGEGNPFGTVKVDGVVTLDGQAVDGATVVFQPATGAGKAATGMTDKDGKFTLTTHAAGDGAMPGSYKVSVTKFETETGPDTSNMSFEEALKASQEFELARQKKANAKGELPPPKELLPAKYKNPEKSGLTFEVKASGENHADLKLSK
jgi:hypothetical protein